MDPQEGDSASKKIPTKVGVFLLSWLGEHYIVAGKTAAQSRENPTAQQRISSRAKNCKSIVIDFTMLKSVLTILQMSYK